MIIDSGQKHASDTMPRNMRVSEAPRPMKSPLIGADWTGVDL